MTLICYYYNQEGDTPLHAAARRGYVDICALLLVEGAKVNAKDEVRITIG
jgi:ankyrin repeat protein